MKTFEQILKDAGILNEDDILNRNYEACAEIYASQFQPIPQEQECVHPYSSVIGDGEMQPAKCLACGKILSGDVPQEQPKIPNAVLEGLQQDIANVVKGKEPQSLPEDELFEAWMAGEINGKDTLSPFIPLDREGSKKDFDKWFKSYCKSHSPQSYSVPSDEDIAKKIFAICSEMRPYDGKTLPKTTPEMLNEFALWFKSKIKAVDLREVLMKFLESIDIVKYQNTPDIDLVDEYLSQRNKE